MLRMSVYHLAYFFCTLMLPPSRSLFSRLYDQCVRPVLVVLSSGLSVETLAWSFALGMCCGIFPVPGMNNRDSTDSFDFYDF